MTSWRVPGVIGLNFFNAMVLQSRSYIDCLAFGQGDDCFLDVALATEMTAETFLFPLAQDGVDRRYLDAKKAFNGAFNLRL